MRNLLDLFVRKPFSRGEILDESYQFYKVVERVEKYNKKIWHTLVYITMLCIGVSL